MHHRLICAFLAALMPFLLVAPVLAQDDTPAFPVVCGDLPADDCAILEEATLAGQELTAYAMNMTMMFSMAGIPDMPADPLAFNMAFDGRFLLDETAHAAAQRLQLIQSGDAEARQALLEEMPDLMIDLYSGVNFDMTMTYSLPPELAAVMSDDSDVQFPATLSFDMRMIDGMVYINIGQLRDLMPESDDSITSDWLGLDYIGMLEMQLEGGVGMNDSMLAGAAGGMAMAQMMTDMQEFVTVERLADVELDGQQGAVFTYTPDIVGFFSSDVFVNMLGELSIMMGEEAASAAEVEEAATMLSFMAPMLFRDLEIGMSTTIGLDDFMTYESEFNLVWDLASLMQFAAMSDPSLGEAMGDAEPLIQLDAVINMSDFNTETEFEVPEDVQIIPLEEMMPMDTNIIS